MGITSFFEDTLGANLSNPRWSWGAFNPQTNQLFLRVWRDQLGKKDGAEFITVLRKKIRMESLQATQNESVMWKQLGMVLKVTEFCVRQ